MNFKEESDSSNSSSAYRDENLGLKMGAAKSTPEPPPGMEPGVEGLGLPEELPGDMEPHPMAVPDLEVSLCSLRLRLGVAF